ncbi:type II toxin-antitoxin system VapC family toxin [Tomitella cavernea]|uniref:Ribonuclease VapC n=1 Tax=Tomitella cavernea TaxID=1387982 RepID=A0ABP9CJC4_9ACTN|nr:type II toxin-antitoxin system VapC family toxin [Tomitella cavernea]
MIYFDTSALVKLIGREAETAPLIGWIESREAVPQVTSALTRVELIRVARRQGLPELVDRARRVLDAVDTLPITPHVIDSAASVGLPALRSLDALHLASALQIAEHLTDFVAYDRRLAVAAGSLGLNVVSPAGRAPSA